MNIIETVKGYIGSDVVDQIGRTLGLGESQTRTAVNAAVPAVLGGLTSVASTPDGARKLADAVDDQDDSMLNSITGMLGNRGDSVVSHGSSMLSSLLGSGMLGGLSSALGKFTGLTGGSITSLLGVLAPILLGVLKKQKNTQGLDASGLANMLGGQKQNIAAAMPSGLASALGTVPGFSALKDWGREKTTPAYAVARDTYATPGRETYAAGRETVPRTVPDRREPVHEGAGTSVLKWVLPLLLLGLITWVAVNWMSNRSRPAPITPAPATRQPTTPQDNLGYVPPTEDVNTITKGLTSISDEATQVLAGVTDEASAEAAVSKITQINTRLDSLHKAYDVLPSSQRGTFTNLVSKTKGTLQTQIDRVKTIPGVGPILDQHLSTMMEKFGSFGT